MAATKDLEPPLGTGTNVVVKLANLRSGSAGPGQRSYSCSPHKTIMPSDNRLRIVFDDDVLLQPSRLCYV